ncbi:hypothetical protein BV25DRAFT_1024699 [Artomyces pyxidatus]|uniref:Uncharacterized protein n=1 Tax=Artomyces pyxidatus TaxID=48021 RepID=A0ACB8SV78_9AGAM|nr:hypothetical protein BV25DRAFT_1024699 [Artomyces pyxidatus]
MAQHLAHSLLILTSPWNVLHSSTARCVSDLTFTGTPSLQPPTYASYVLHCLYLVCLINTRYMFAYSPAVIVSPRCGQSLSIYARYVCPDTVATRI